MSEPIIPTSNVVSVDLHDHVAVVWLDRPEKRNALAPDFWVEFPRVLEALGTNEDVRAIVVAGRGASFTVGLDLLAFGPAVLAGVISAIRGEASPSDVA